MPVNAFKWVEDISEFDESFMISNNEESDEGYFLEGDVQYPEHLHNLHNGLPFLPEKMKTENVGKLVASLHNKTQSDCMFLSCHVHISE